MSESKNEVAVIDKKEVALFKEIRIENGLLQMGDLGAVHEFSRLAVASGIYEDMDSVAKGTMKIVYGISLGLTAQESLNSVFFVKGRAGVFAQTIAQKIKESSRYDYKILHSGSDYCELEVFESDKSVGKEKFTWEQAVAMKVTGKQAWLADPALMLFYKAVTRVYKKYCADIFKIGVQSVEDMSDAETTVIANEVTTPGTDAPNFAKAVETKAKKKASTRAKEDQPAPSVEEVPEDAEEVAEVDPTAEDREEAKKEVFEENGMVAHAEAIQDGIDKAAKPFVPDLHRIVLFGTVKKWKPEHVTAYIKNELKKEPNEIDEQEYEALKIHVKTNAPKDYK